MEKPKVLSIQALVNKDENNNNIDSTDAKSSKPFKIKRPKTIPLKSERSTLLV